MFVLSASKVWLWVQRDGGMWSFLTRTKIIYRFTGIRKWVMRWWKRPFWFSKKIYVTFFSKWTFPYQGGCSQVLISSRKFDSSICDWKNKFSIFFGKYHLWCVHRFQLLNVCNQYVTLPNSHRVQSVSKEQSRQDFLSKLMDSWLVFRRSRAIINQWIKRTDRSIKWFSKRCLVRSFPIRQEILNICR